jgi:hypothetical protein
MQANKFMAFDICQKRIIPEKYHILFLKINSGSLRKKKAASMIQPFLVE